MANKNTEEKKFISTSKIVSEGKKVTVETEIVSDVVRKEEVAFRYTSSTMSGCRLDSLNIEEFDAAAKAVAEHRAMLLVSFPNLVRNIGTI